MYIKFRLFIISAIQWKISLLTRSSFSPFFWTIWTSTGMATADGSLPTIAFASDMAALVMPTQSVIYPRHDIQTHACVMHICSAIMETRPLIRLGPGPKAQGASVPHAPPPQLLGPFFLVLGPHPSWLNTCASKQARVCVSRLG